MSMNTRCTLLSQSSFQGRSLRAVSTVLTPTVRPRRLLVENRTLWSLQVDQQWCDLNEDKCKTLQPSLDLSDAISENLKCLVGETKNCDFSVSCGKTGVEAKFESVGASNPLDSPAELFVTDVGGSTKLTVDDQTLNVGDKVQLNPGSTVKFGDFAQFQVLRNVEAHA